MRYQGSEAYDLEARPRRYGAEPTEPARPLVVLEGGHLDEEARRGVSPQFVRLARIVVVAVAVLCALGAARVFLTAGTVSLLQDNMALRTQIQEADALNDELAAERSLLSSAARIKRIATQYGMEYEVPSATIDLAQGSVDAEQDAG